MKNNKGVSMLSLVITIVVIIIIALVAFASSTRMIDEADYSKYANNVSEVGTFFEKTSVNMHGSDLLKDTTMRDEQIYNFVAKGGSGEADFLAMRELPAYTVIANNADIGMELPNIKIESGTGHRIPVKYAVTKHGEIFTWPPYDYNGELYITSTNTVSHKMQTEITVGDETFSIVIDPSDGSLVDAPINEIPNVTPGQPEVEVPEMPEIPKEDILEHKHDFSSQTATDLYLSTVATCKTKATYYYKCSGCAEKGTSTYTHGTYAAHKFGNWTINQESTCSQIGKKTRSCTVCGTSEESVVSVDANKHINVEIRVITQPGCTTAGSQEQYCKDCEKVIVQETVSSKGHNFTGATCVEKGKCTNCGELTNALGHDWNSASPRVCNRCGATEGGVTTETDIEEMSWEQIKEISKGGNPDDYFDVGDSKTVTLLDGRTFEMEIIAFNKDEKADGSGVAGITWLVKNGIDNESMNSTRDNVNGWKGSEMRTWLQNDFYNTFPQELKAVIIPVNKTYYDYTSRSTMMCVDNLWIPSYRELFGGEGCENSGAEYTEYFTDDTSRIRTSEGKSWYNPNYWLRTAKYHYTPVFYKINSSGNTSGRTTSDSSGGVIFGFCT